MSNFSSGDFSAEDMADIAAAEAAHDAAHASDGNVPLGAAAPAAAPAPALTPETTAQPAAPAQAPAAATPAQASAPAPAGQPSQAPAPQAQGDVRAALRASRRAEHQTRQERDRLARENEELRKKVGSTEPGDKLPEDVLEDVKTYAPKAAEYIAQLEAKVKASPAPTAPATEFTPMVFDPEVQDLIDDIPALAAWHANPDQTAFTLARKADALLQDSPLWANRPDAERLAEAVRLTQAQLGQPQAQAPAPRDPAAVAAAAIAAAPIVAAPVSIGGMGSGTQPQPMRPDYRKMTDDEIMNLPE